MNNYNFSQTKKSLLVKAGVTSLAIKGSDNIITLEANIPNLVISGNHNQIIASHNNSRLSNVITNGNYNTISALNINFNIINHGKDNLINNNPIRGFGSLNNINISNIHQDYILNFNENGNRINICDFINNINVTAQPNMNNYYEYNDEESDNYENDIEEYYYSDGEEEAEIEGVAEAEVDSEPDKEEENDIFNNDNNNQLLDSRMNIILDFNEFQFKNAGKYISKPVDKCSLCKIKFTKTDIIRQFACGDHIFHRKCISKWLTKSDKCPECRYDLKKGIIDNNKKKSSHTK